MKNTNHINKVDEYIYKCLSNGELDNDDLVQIIERINTYLNLKTIQRYANDNKISYNGAKNHRGVINVIGLKLIPDNN